MPRREAKIAVNASPEALWKFLRDFQSLCTCIPGVEKIDLVDDRTADVTVREKVGVIPMVLTLRATIESEEPPRRLHAVARAEHLTMAIDVALARTATGTELVSVFDVTGTGQLKAIVDRLFEKRATERTAQFAECLEKRFSGTPEMEKPAPQPGWIRGLLERLKAFFRRPAP
jgi:carbon monoxide dehydrogenase subunit G